ncbi:hypothetical protein [Nocardia sp. NPDC004860]|uniref:hypothetical protein n=1 Tax=Nocardia sp. NPDC004860 TaxID=3154557 RepID=UPI0033B2A2CA
MSALRSRVSLHPYAFDGSAPPGHGGLYCSMLLDDFDHQQYAFEIGLDYGEHDPARGAAVVAGLLDELGFGSEDPARLFVRLVTAVGHDHLMYGRSMFELYTDDQDPMPGARLGVLPGWSLQRRIWGTFQNTQTAGEQARRKIPADVLVTFELPVQLRRDLHRTWQCLTALRPSHTALTPVTADLARSSYDRAAHRRSLDAMAARATRSIGWDGRELFLPQATSSYRIYRRLRFLRTWLAVADSVLATLNQVCAHPEVCADVPLTISVSGLPTIEDIDGYMAAVADGSQSLDSIVETVFDSRSA